MKKITPLQKTIDIIIETLETIVLWLAVFVALFLWVEAILNVFREFFAILNFITNHPYLVELMLMVSFGIGLATFPTFTKLTNALGEKTRKTKGKRKGRKSTKKKRWPWRPRKPWRPKKQKTPTQVEPKRTYKAPLKLKLNNF